MTVNLTNAWEQIEAWLHQNAPSLAERLGPGAGSEEISAAEEEIGSAFPNELRAHLARHNGSDEAYVLGRWYLMDTGYIVEEYRTNLEIATDQGDTSFWKSNWVPVLGDGAGNFLALDLSDGSLVSADNDPYERGKAATSLSAWLAEVALDMKAGRYSVEEEGEAIVRAE
jgi:cell wall assembly regulator SMI1